MEITNYKCQLCGSSLVNCSCGERISIDCNFCFNCGKKNDLKTENNEGGNKN